MKLLQISTFYPAYLHKFYSQNPRLADQEYSLQKKALLYDGFGWSDFWLRALFRLSYNGEVCIANAEALQKVWASERGVRYTENNWLEEIIEAQILDAKPEILFLEDYALFSTEKIFELRRKCPSIRLTIAAIGAPFKDISMFEPYDLVVSCIPEFVEQFNKVGIRARHLAHAFEPDILMRIDTTRLPTDDFTFIGQVVKGAAFHKNREEALRRISKELPIKIYTPSKDLRTKDVIKARAKQVAYLSVVFARHLGMKDKLLCGLPCLGSKLTNLIELQTMPPTPCNRILKRFMKSGVFGLQMFQTLHDSKITFNSHIDASPRYASNMRIFEATGVGACLVTDWKENISDLFEPDSEIVTYKSIDECIEKVRWLLDHPKERKMIAQAGQKKTLGHHTFAQRADQLDQMIRDALC